MVFLVKKLFSSLLERSEKYLLQGITLAGCSDGMWWILVGAQKFDFHKVEFWPWLNPHFHVGIILWVCCTRLEHLFIGLLLGECFCEKLITYVSFICATLTWCVLHNDLWLHNNTKSKDLFVCYCKNFEWNL